jgi:hypothetical protein
VNATQPTTETIARFSCPKCGVRVLFVGPAERIRPMQDNAIAEHAREE